MVEYIIFIWNRQLRGRGILDLKETRVAIGSYEMYSVVLASGESVIAR